MPGIDPGVSGWHRRADLRDDAPAKSFESGDMTHRGLLHHMLINVADVRRSSPFYTGMFTYFGYELNDSGYGEEYGYEDWKRWDLDTPHEISICQVRAPHRQVAHIRGALGHHDHLAFCAADRDDVDRFHQEILLPLAEAGH
jgi:hypothetical protein